MGLIFNLLKYLARILSDGIKLNMYGKFILRQVA